MDDLSCGERDEEGAGNDEDQSRSSTIETWEVKDPPKNGAVEILLDEMQQETEEDVARNRKRCNSPESFSFADAETADDNGCDVETHFVGGCDDGCKAAEGVIEGLASVETSLEGLVSVENLVEDMPANIQNSDEETFVIEDRVPVPLDFGCGMGC